MGGAVVLGVTLLVMVGITLFLTGQLARSIQNEKRTSMKVMKNFGLSIGFCLLFLISWVGHGAAQWQKFTDEQIEHGQAPAIGDFLADFSSSTLENWQSEFLQLFSFTVMSAILIHKGSAESRDSSDRIEAALKRIEDQLGTEPTARTEPLREGKDLHVVPTSFEGWALKDESSEEPEGYYDTQQEAIKAGRELASKLGVKLYTRGQDGVIRDQTGGG